MEFFRQLLEEKGSEDPVAQWCSNVLLMQEMQIMRWNA